MSAVQTQKRKGAGLPRSVLVVGLGRSGQAVAEVLLEAGASVVAVEDHPRPETRKLAEALGVELVEQPDALTLRGLARRQGIVVVSPGVPVSHPAYSLSGVEIVGELELASQLVSVPMVAVTGTNGKTTVTAMVTEMLNRSGIRTVAAGNIGFPLIKAAFSEAEAIVVEASSFQLYLTRKFHPRVAGWLNLSPDHLDWHPSLRHYAASKARIWQNMRQDDVAVGNKQSPIVARELAKVSCRKVSFGRTSGDWRTEGEWLLAPDGSEVVSLGKLWRGFPADIENSLAASALATSAGASLEAVRFVLENFSGLPHRIQLVGSVDGVRYFDDSKATTPDAMVAAVAAFDSVVLIAGGRNKKLSFEEAARLLAPRLRAVVCIGEAADELCLAFGAAAVATEKAASMAEAVELASRLARPGDTVLLSPGCTSFDWYANYEERGDDFARCVLELADRRGLSGV